MAQRITVDIVAETAQLRAGLEQANQQLSGLQAGVSKINQVTSAVAGIGVAAAGLSKATGFITQAAGAASDLAETTSKVGQIFGDASEEVLKFSQGTAKSIGQSSQQALDAAATFGIFGKAAGLAGGDLAKFSTDFTVLASDLASFNNTSPQDAINALGAALRGESEPLRRYGVLLNEDALKAEALSLGLTKANVSTTKVALAQAKAQKAAKAYADAIKKYGDQSGEAAEKQALLEKAQQDLSKATSGVSEKLDQSQKILAAQSLIYKQTADAQGDFARTSDGLANSQRILEASQADLNTNLGQAFLPIMKEVTRVVQIAVDIFTALPGPIQTLVVGFGLLVATIGPLIILINSVKTALVALEVAKLASAAAAGIATGATTLLSAALTALPIVAVIALIVLLVKNWDTVSDVVKKVWEYIKDFGEWLFPYIKGAFNAVIDWLKDNWPKILAILSGPFGLFILFLAKHKDELLAKIEEIWNKVKEVGSKIVTAYKDAVVGIFNTLYESILEKMASIKTTIEYIWEIIKTVTERIVTNMIKAVLDLWNSFYDGLIKIVTFLKDTIISIWNKLKDTTTTVFNGIQKKASEIWTNIKDYIIGVVKNVLERFSTVRSQMIEVGKDIARGIIDGLINIKGWFVDRLTQWVNDNIPKVVRELLKISSPSQVFAGIGENIAQGLYSGLGTGNIPLASNSASGAATAGAVNITINAGLGTDPIALGREVQKAIRTYGKYNIV